MAQTAVVGYDAARQFSRRVRRQAKTLVAEIDGRDARLQALLGFVRERLSVTDSGAIFVAERASLDRVLGAGEGTGIEVALVLQAMLETAKIPAALVWATDWRDGRLQPGAVQPGVFAKVLVGVEHDGAWTYLDPTDRRLPVGRLAPTQEGTAAVRLDGARATVVTLPMSPAARNERRVELDLQVAADGGVHGTGTLRLNGHHAWFLLGRRGDAAAAREAWRQWLINALPAFTVDDVTVVERFDRQTIEVTWFQRMRPEATFDDEVVVELSRPLGPIRQRYTLPPDRRQTPVQLSFADRDAVAVRLQWPPAWQFDVAPAAVEIQNQAGQAMARAMVDPSGHSLTYARVLEIDQTVLFPPDAYGALQQLYAALERHDADSLVLVRE